MVAEVLNPDKVDPTDDIGLLTILSRTFKGKITTSSDTNQNDMELIKNYHQSVAIKNSENFMEQAREISSRNAEDVNNELPCSGQSGNKEEDIVVENEKLGGKQRRPGLLGDTKRPKFSLKSNVMSSQTNFNLEEMEKEIDKISDPVEYFNAHERLENARKEIQRQTGGIPTNSVKDTIPGRTRVPRPGLGTVRQKHRYSWVGAGSNEVFSQPEADFSSQSTDKPITETMDKHDPIEESILVDDGVEKDSVAAQNNVNHILAELLSTSCTDLDGDGAVSFLQERLQLKPIVVDKLSLPDLDSFRSISVTATVERAGKSRESLSEMESLIRQSRNKTSTETHLSANTSMYQRASPTSPESPLASVSLLRKRLSQMGQTASPFSFGGINCSPVRNTSPVKGKDIRDNSRDAECGHNNETNDTTAEAPDKKASSSCCEFQSAMLVNDDTAGTNTVLEKLSMYTEDCSAGGPGGVLQDKVEDVCQETSTCQQKEADLEGLWNTDCSGSLLDGVKSFVGEHQPGNGDSQAANFHPMQNNEVEDMQPKGVASEQKEPGREDLPPPPPQLLQVVQPLQLAEVVEPLQVIKEQLQRNSYDEAGQDGKENPGSHPSDEVPVPSSSSLVVASKLKEFQKLNIREASTSNPRISDLAEQFTCNGKDYGKWINDRNQFRLEAWIKSAVYRKEKRKRFRAGLLGDSKRPKFSLDSNVVRTVRQKHRYSWVEAGSNEVFLSQPEADFSSQSTDKPITETMDKHDPTEGSIFVDAGLEKDSVAAQNNINRILAEPLSTSCTDLNGDGAVSFLQERVQLKPRVVDKSSLPDLDSFRSVSVTETAERADQSRESLSEMESLIQQSRTKTSTEIHLSANASIYQRASSTSPESPLVSVSLLRKRLSQMGQTASPFSFGGINSSPVRNTSPIKGKDIQDNSPDIECGHNNEANDTTTEAPDKKASSACCEFQSAMLVNDDTAGANTVSEKLSMYTEVCSAGGPGGVLQDMVEDMQPKGVASEQKEPRLEVLPSGDIDCIRSQLGESISSTGKHQTVDAVPQNSDFLTEQNEETYREPPLSVNRKRKPPPENRFERQKSRQKSLAEAGTKGESEVRRSTRVRTKPLKYRQGEQFLVGRVQNESVSSTDKHQSGDVVSENPDILAEQHKETNPEPSLNVKGKKKAPAQNRMGRRSTSQKGLADESVSSTGKHQSGDVVSENPNILAEQNKESCGQTYQEPSLNEKRNKKTPAQNRMGRRSTSQKGLADESVPSMGKHQSGDVVSENPDILAEQQEKTYPDPSPTENRKKKAPAQNIRERLITSWKNLAGAGTKSESGARRSTRHRVRPLEFWKGERLLFGRVHESSLSTVIGVKYESPPKSKKEKPTFRVKSLVSDAYKELEIPKS